MKRLAALTCCFALVFGATWAGPSQGGARRSEHATPRIAAPLTITMLADGDTIRYDPFTGVVEYENPDTLLIGVLSRNERGETLRFRLAGGEELTIELSHPDSLTGTRSMLTRIEKDGVSTFERDTPVTPDDLRGVDFTVQTQDGLTSQSATSAITDLALSNESLETADANFVWVPFAIAAVVCRIGVAACHNDVATALNFCLASCAGLGMPCLNCCAGLADDDNVNCTFTCGANGPDGDYGNCTNPNLPPIYGSIGNGGSIAADGIDQGLQP